MAGSVTSRQYVLARRPDGVPGPEDFSLVERELGPPAAGEVLVRVATFSVDPYMRGRMRADAGAPWTVDYDEPWALEEPLEAIGIGTVEASDHPDFASGDVVRGRFVWGEYCVVAGDDLEHVPEVEPPTAALSVVGMPGRTAYFGLFDVGDPRPGIPRTSRTPSPRPVPTASTSTSTTSVGQSPTPWSPTSRTGRAWSSAGRSRCTTRSRCPPGHAMHGS